MHASNVVRAAVASLLLWGAGCVSTESRLTLGAQCELSSECEAPLVCRLERCRKECVSSRDCALGLRCVLAEDGLGVCQLPEETSCMLNSECPEPLVCSGQVGCTNECEDAMRDCPPGAQCVPVEGGGMQCEEPELRLCVYHSDCPEPLVCNLRQQCQFECSEEYACAEDGRVCVQHEICNGPCMCRLPCDGGCPPGSSCVDCPEGFDCGRLDSYCERNP